MTLRQYSSDTWLTEFLNTEFLNIIEIPARRPRKTKIWIVRTKYDGETLGTVAWFSHWRKYAFSPASNCIFEQDCLRGLAQFMEDRTNEHKAKPKEVTVEVTDA